MQLYQPNTMGHSSSRPSHTWVVCLLLMIPGFAVSYDGPLYDTTAYTECKLQPEQPLYNGGILKHKDLITIGDSYDIVHHTLAFILYNLTHPAIYSFSVWVKIGGASSALIKAGLKTDNATYNCIGSVLSRPHCWSFLKGGFVLDSPSSLALLFFENSDDREVNIQVASASLQPFTDQQWRINQQYVINKIRKRAVTIHISDRDGSLVQGAGITVNQVSKDFPVGSAIANTILGNQPYQDWFTRRFDATVFENELKWYATEPEQGKINYTIPDQMLHFVRKNKLIARGHNIFWEDPKYVPAWARNLTSDQLRSAVSERINSLVGKYREEFIHWDVSNEMLHFDFYERRLGDNATVEFYEAVHEADPLATLFLNEYNVVETCSDSSSNVDRFISKLMELERKGVTMNGIGLEAHFTVPNVPLMRAVLDKLATLRLPIWLTEVDINHKIVKEKQAVYLEQVMREGFSHPSVNGIMLWTALHPYGCYEMCLTDGNFHNLPAGDVVDELLEEWRTAGVSGKSDEHGSFSFFGFLGEYRVSVSSGGTTVDSTFSLSGGRETKHVGIKI